MLEVLMPGVMHGASCSLRSVNAGLAAAAQMEVDWAEDLRRAGYAVTGAL
jgi:hypothetical protein